jgi:hypothetical protein
MVEALQIYVTFLEPTLIRSVTRLLNSDFLRAHLSHIHDIIDANTRDDADRKVAFFWASAENGHRCGYEDFWDRAGEVLSLCSDQRTSTGEPLFWREEHERA